MRVDFCGMISKIVFFQNKFCDFEFSIEIIQFTLWWTTFLKFFYILFDLLIKKSYQKLNFHIIYSHSSKYLYQNKYFVP